MRKNPLPPRREGDVWNTIYDFIIDKIVRHVIM
jgi:hypothetical protein